MLQASKLNRRVHVCRPLEVVDDLGAHILKLEDMGYLWANIDVPRASASLLGGQELDVRSHVVTVRDLPFTVLKDDILETEGRTKLRVKVLDTRPDPNNGCIYCDCTSEFSDEVAR